ncbi:hypothetical protein BCR33DRAFT_789016 [Rhizoclosmatium globosum]|uniref:Uncharacterized protein n=1 Tax=Rhizoclosmatium globosum TaxID=329046 RepID=A0A1Y2BUN0_9FUNG|nr:hypothetical protein BCR33DRAFT_789016 [Rhizoclosmatium globosum]|eukprot:ORY38443.1 hypothetical protein BCR33DRAFT_789016 [Rhizoclosmatium globosum]
MVKNVNANPVSPISASAANPVTVDPVTVGPSRPVLAPTPVTASTASTVSNRTLTVAPPTQPQSTEVSVSPVNLRFSLDQPPSVPDSDHMTAQRLLHEICDNHGKNIDASALERKLAHLMFPLPTRAELLSPNYLTAGPDGNPPYRYFHLHGIYQNSKRLHVLKLHTGKERRYGKEVDLFKYSIPPTFQAALWKSLKLRLDFQLQNFNRRYGEFPVAQTNSTVLHYPECRINRKLANGIAVTRLYQHWYKETTEKPTELPFYRRLILAFLRETAADDIMVGQTQAPVGLSEEQRDRTLTHNKEAIDVNPITEFNNGSLQIKCRLLNYLDALRENNPELCETDSE